MKNKSKCITAIKSPPLRLSFLSEKIFFDISHHHKKARLAFASENLNLPCSITGTNLQA